MIGRISPVVCWVSCYWRFLFLIEPHAITGHIYVCIQIYIYIYMYVYIWKTYIYILYVYIWKISILYIYIYICIGIRVSSKQHSTTWKEIIKIMYKLKAMDTTLVSTSIIALYLGTEDCQFLIGDESSRLRKYSWMAA